MNAEGALVWYIPDAYLPQPIAANGPYVGHEAVCILNVSSQDAHVSLDLYFENRPQPRISPSWFRLNGLAM